jgi:nitrogen regulatory protein PII
MVVSENTLKWLMRLYPPLLFQRIWVRSFDKGFRGVNVKIIKSIFNKNYNGSIFGGTIFAAADPFYPVLFDRVLNTGDRKLRIWSKSSKIDFLKPALSSVSFNIVLTDADIELAIKTLNTNGKYEHCFLVEIFDHNNEVCASLMNEVYIRDLNFKPTAVL